MNTLAKLVRSRLRIRVSHMDVSPDTTREGLSECLETIKPTVQHEDVQASQESTRFHSVAFKNNGDNHVS